METFTQPKITGYRQLNEAEAQLMNEIKAKGVELEALIEKLFKRSSEQWVASRNDEAERKRLEAANPEKWLSQGTHQLQTGLMFLTRAVAQPTTF